MYHQFNTQQLHVLPHTAVFMCFVWISEQTAIISLYNINWLVFVTQTETVYCAVRFNIHARCVYCAVPKQFKLTAVCKVSNAQNYGSDIIFGNSVLFITLHNDSRQTVCVL